MTGGAQGGDRRAAAQADQIVEDRVAAQTQLFRHVAGDAGTEITRTGAQEKRVELVGPQLRLRQGPAQGRTRETRGLAPKTGIQLVGRQIVNVLEVVQGEMARGDAAVAGQYGAKDELRTPVEAVQRSG